MKVILICVLLSLGLGYGIASYREGERNKGIVHLMGGSADLDADLAKWEVKEKADQKPGKIEVIGGNAFDFGTMKRGARRSHKFQFKNSGEGPAEIWFIRSTCKCTLGKFDRAKLKPGETTDVELEWVLEGYEVFVQTATIGSTVVGQEEITLTISGNVGQSHVFDPPSLVIGDHLAKDELTLEGKLYCLEEIQMDFNEAVIANLAVAQKIRCQVEPVRSVTDEERGKFPDAKSVLEYKVFVDKGLGAANLNATIDFRNRNAPESEVASIPISGRIITPVRMIAGSDFNEDRKILKLGVARSKDGLKKSVMMAVSTSEYPEAEIAFKEIIPKELEDSMKVTVGKPLVRGKQKTFPVTIELPPGTPPVEKTGFSGKEFAKVTFTTNMENSPTESIYVQFRITE